jgi:A/G-specific adenine glycosylase
MFRRRLLRWYACNGRDLPWRHTRDPYRILVSEFMLQQTPVERVKGFYRRFLGRYPTVTALAAARPAAVREAWDGLGYYARSRNLHRAARLLVARHGARLPRDAALIRALPGVGPYTANAVRSFAFGEAVAILDTNAARVLERVFGVPGPRRGSGLVRRLWALAEEVTPPRRAYDFNQAIMDLGATVCHARAPCCERCPLRRMCRFRERAGSTRGRVLDHPGSARI